MPTKRVYCIELTFPRDGVEFIGLFLSEESADAYAAKQKLDSYSVFSVFIQHEVVL